MGECKRVIVDQNQMQIFSAISWREQVDEMVMMSSLYLTNKLRWIFIVLAYWSNCQRIDMSFHSDTLSWFRANQTLLLLLNQVNAVCLAEKQQIPILQSLVWPNQGSNPRSTTLRLEENILYNYGLHEKLISIIIKLRKGYFPPRSKDLGKITLSRFNNHGY